MCMLLAGECQDAEDTDKDAEGHQQRHVFISILNKHERERESKTLNGQIKQSSTST